MFYPRFDGLKTGKYVQLVPADMRTPEDIKWDEERAETAWREQDLLMTPEAMVGHDPA